MPTWRAGSSKDECKVHNVQTLGMAEDIKARKLLEDIAWRVQPVMRKRGWQCSCLSEFLPKNASLRGINYGGGDGKSQEIRLRLRRTDDVEAFYEFEDLLLVMLHELTHNVIGPHNQNFYKLLDEITAECMAFAAKGIGGTGQGFDAPPAGKSGGKGFGAHNPDAGDMRRVALKAAEDRRRLDAIMPKGPRKVGGGEGIMRLFGPKEAAGQAALRREQDNVWCPCETHKKELHSASPDLEGAGWEWVHQDSAGACPMLCSPQKPARPAQHAERPPGSLDPASCQHGDGNKRPDVTVCDLTMDSDSETSSSSPGETLAEACETGPAAPAQDPSSGAAPKHKRRLSWWSRKSSASPKKSPPESPAAPTNSITSLERPSKRLQVGEDAALTAMDVSPKPPPHLCACPSSPDLGHLRGADPAPGAGAHMGPMWGHGRSASVGSLPDACSDDDSCRALSASSPPPPPSRSVSPMPAYMAADDLVGWPAPVDKGKGRAPCEPYLTARLFGGSDEEEAFREWVPIPGNPCCTREVGEPSGLTWEERHVGMNWTCDRCTLINQANTSVCAACEAPCPKCSQAEDRLAVVAVTSGSAPPTGEKQSVFSRLFKSTSEAPAPFTTAASAPPPAPTNAGSAERAGNPLIRAGSLMGFKGYKSQGQRLLAASQQP